MWFLQGHPNLCNKNLSFSFLPLFPVYSPLTIGTAFMKTWLSCKVFLNNPLRQLYIKADASLERDCIGKKDRYK